MVLKLYGHPVSICTRRIRIALEEKKIQYELIVVDFLKGEHLPKPYGIEFHPFKKIPVLVDTESGVKGFESRAICQYIAAKYRSSGPNLSPSDTDSKNFASFQQALSVELSYFEPNVSTIASEVIFKTFFGQGPADEEVVKARLDALDNAFEGYERILSKQNYLAGNDISLADLFHFPFGVLVEEAGFAELLPKYPAVRAWWEGLKARDSWKSVSATE